MSNAIPVTRTRRKAQTPEERRRSKIIQISLGVVVSIVVLFFAYLAQQTNPAGAFIILVGTGFGYTLQRSRFCFTSSLRDPLLTGTTDLTKAVVIALTLASLVFMALNMQKFGMDLKQLEVEKALGNVRPIGLHTAIGGFLFGIGAVIAGGCASGTLMRMGEGYAQNWLAFVFFVFGSMLGTALLNLMKTSPIFWTGTAVFLPEVLGGWIPAVIVQFGALFGLYVAADYWGKKKAGAL